MRSTSVDRTCPHPATCDRGMADGAKIAVTGSALCCALGRDAATALSTLFARQPGLGEPPFDLPFATLTGTVEAPLPVLPPGFERYHSRAARLALLALSDDIGFWRARTIKRGAERVALILGTSTGGIDRTEDAYFSWKASGVLPDDYAYRSQHAFHALTDFVAAYLELRGPRYVVSTACSSSAKAFASARRLLAADAADAVIVAGVDALCHTTVRGFNSLGVMADGQSKPFAEKRPGMNVGEAACFLMLERADELADDDPDPLAYVAGVGESSDAYHMSSPHPEGAGAQAAMRRALAAARLEPAAIDHVNAHGTGTAYNDSAEAIAIDAVFEQRALPVVSTKAYTGHTLGACGAVEALFCIEALRRGKIPAALEEYALEPGIAFTIPNASIEMQMRYVMSNAFAFGGNNASVILERAS